MPAHASAMGCRASIKVSFSCGVRGMISCFLLCLGTLHSFLSSTSSWQLKQEMSAIHSSSWASFDFCILATFNIPINTLDTSSTTNPLSVKLGTHSGCARDASLCLNREYLNTLLTPSFSSQIGITSPNISITVSFSPPRYSTACETSLPLKYSLQVCLQLVSIPSSSW